MSVENPTFYGDGYEVERDHTRLTKALRLVYDVMRDQQWHTLRDIECETNQPQASISAHIRTLRRPENGGYCIHKRYKGNGLHEYRMQLDAPTNWQPKVKKERPRDILQMEAEHGRMKEAIKEAIEHLGNGYDPDPYTVCDNVRDMLIRKALGYDC